MNYTTRHVEGEVPTDGQETLRMLDDYGLRSRRLSFPGRQGLGQDATIDKVGAAS